MKKTCTNCHYDPSPTEGRCGIQCRKTNDGYLPYAEDDNGDCTFWSKQKVKGKLEYGELTYGRVL